GGPGLAAVGGGRHGRIMSVSCGSAGSCAAGGFYVNGHGSQGFVVSERHGRWGLAIEVPGLGALNAGAGSVEGAYVGSVSCRSAGNCAAGGAYFARHRHAQGVVGSETNGRWGRAVGVPGVGALNRGGEADVSSVSCGSAGNCAAGGRYTDSHGHYQGFVASETNGVWGRAIEVPGLGALNKPPFGGYGAEVLSVSCGSAGNCAAGGYYSTGSRGARDGTGGWVGGQRHGRRGGRSWPARATAGGGWRSRYRG